MLEKEFLRCVNQELDWLKYYTWGKSREKLTLNSNLYEDLAPMGYVKRQLPLYNRCAPCFVTADSKIVESFNVEDIYDIAQPRNHQENRYTPLEAYLIIYPDKKQEIINRLK